VVNVCFYAWWCWVMPVCSMASGLGAYIDGTNVQDLKLHTVTASYLSK
jgi:hypothetical protein